MPRMEELKSKISKTIADGPADKIWISKFEYGQLHLSKQSIDLCISAVTEGNLPVTITF